MSIFYLFFSTPIYDTLYMIDTRTYFITVAAVCLCFIMVCFIRIHNQTFGREEDSGRTKSAGNWINTIAAADCAFFAREGGA